MFRFAIFLETRGLGDLQTLVRRLFSFECGVVRTLSGRHEYSTKVEWTPFVEWCIVLLCGERAPRSVCFYQLSMMTRCYASHYPTCSGSSASPLELSRLGKTFSRLTTWTKPSV